MRGAKDEEEGNKKDKDQVLKWHKKKYKTFMRRPLPKRTRAAENTLSFEAPHPINTQAVVMNWFFTQAKCAEATAAAAPYQPPPGAAVSGLPKKTDFLDLPTPVTYGDLQREIASECNTVNSCVFWVGKSKHPTA